MALFAKDQTEIVSAWEATPHSLYACIECQLPLKVRRSKLQFPHFYHLKSSPNCRLYSKSERHLLIQTQIQKLLPEGEAILEKPYPSIHRIADVAWEKQGLVFEIQCSLIAQSQAEERMLEYRSIGMEVVWILDDRIFNKKYLRPAEKKIRENLSYFIWGSSFFFYDQFEILHKNKRLKKSEKMQVYLSQPKPITSKTLHPSQQIAEKIARTKKFFQGDLIDRAQNPLFSQKMADLLLQEKEAAKENFFKEKIYSFFYNLKRAYIHLLNQLLRGRK